MCSCMQLPVKYVRRITGKFQHIILHTGVSYWTWCCKVDRWSVAVLSAERGHRLAPSPSPCIFYHGRIWKAIQWNHQREGKDVAGVLSSLTSPHLRGHRGTDTLQHLSAGRGPFKSLRCSSDVPTTAIVCLSPPIQSRVGDLSLIKARCQPARPSVPPLLPFEVGRNIKEFDLHWHVCTIKLGGGADGEERVERGRKKNMDVELNTSLIL